MIRTEEASWIKDQILNSFNSFQVFHIQITTFQKKNLYDNVSTDYVYVCELM